MTTNVALDYLHSKVMFLEDFSKNVLARILESHHRPRPRSSDPTTVTASSIVGNPRKMNMSTIWKIHMSNYLIS